MFLPRHAPITDRRARKCVQAIEVDESRKRNRREGVSIQRLNAWVLLNSWQEKSLQLLFIRDSDNVALEVTDLLYAEAQEPLRKMIAGKTVEVIGQFISGATYDQFKTGQNILWCCVADARPIYIPVALSAPVDVSDMEWVKVTGTAELSTSEGRPTFF